MEQLSEISPEILATLAAKLAECHTTHGNRRASLELAEKALQDCGARRASIVARLETTEQKLRDSIGRTLAAVSGDSFEPAAASVAVLRNQVRLLNQGLRWFDCTEYADARRATLAARVEELSASESLERARLEHHEAKAFSLLAAAAEFMGGVGVTDVGEVATRIQIRIGELMRAVAQMRHELKQHDEDAAESLKRYQGEYDHQRQS